MTARDEATVAREALNRLAEQVEHEWDRVRGLTNRSLADSIRDEANRLYAPAPRKVPAELRWAPDGYCRSQGSHSQWVIGYGDRVAFGVPKHLFAQIAALVARADADGMVEEGLGGDSRPKGEAGDKVAPNNPLPPAPTPAPSCAGTAPPSDDLMPEPVSTEQLMTWGRSMGGGDTSHMIDDAPSRRCKAPPSDDPPVGKGQGRPDAPSPQTGAEKDERMWLVWRDREGSQRASQLTAKASRDRSEAEWAHICPNESGHVRVVPKSRLDQAEREVADWKANAERENAMLVTCQEERDKARELAQSEMARADALHATLRRAEEASGRAWEEHSATRTERDALAKRVEEGVVMWRSRLGLYQMHEPDRFERQQYGPFTRGRFVADVAEEDFR